VVSECGLSLSHTHGMQNFVNCVRFLENLFASDPKYVFELLVLAACLHD
jgi:hypothetical protein